MIIFNSYEAQCDRKKGHRLTHDELIATLIEEELENEFEM